MFPSVDNHAFVLLISASGYKIVAVFDDVKGCGVFDVRLELNQVESALTALAGQCLPLQTVLYHKAYSALLIVCRLM
jgi:hypothetical protein